MAKQLDFNKVKKTYMTLILNDDDGTRLQLLTPLKRQVQELNNLLPGNADEPTDEDIEAMYELAARLMSRNKQGYKIEPSLLEDILDFEDLVIFFDAYTDFLMEVSSAKN